MRTSNPIRGTIIAAVALLCGMPAAQAQTSGGSTYSIFNIGDLQVGSTATATGRGGVEAGTPSPGLINSVNPAAWSDLEYVTLQAAMNFEQYRVSDAAGSIYQNNSKLQDFAAAFPYSRTFGGSIGFAVRPYSTVNYRTQQRSAVPGADTSTAITTYNGRGGLSEALVGTSFKPAEWLALGGSFNLYFGSIHQQSEVSFASNALNPANYQTSDLYVGSGARFGAQSEPVEGLRLGAVYELGTEITREQQVSTRFTEAGNNIIDTLSLTEDKLKLPPRVTVGASYLTGRFLFSGDASFQSWGTEQFTTARPENRFAIGVDRLPSTSMNASGFERWTFRFGGFFRQTYYQMVNGEGIDQMGVTLGARWPLGGFGPYNSNTALEMGLELGKRGRTDAGLTEEMYGRLAIQLSVNELWFIRSRR